MKSKNKKKQKERFNTLWNNTKEYYEKTHDEAKTSWDNKECRTLLEIFEDVYNTTKGAKI